MIGSISVGGNDWFGLGTAIGNSAAAKSVDGCGKRPLFGKARKESFDECRMKALDVQMAQARTSGATQPQPMSDQTKLIIGGVVVVVLIILVKLLKK